MRQNALKTSKNNIGSKRSLETRTKISEALKRRFL